MRITEVRVFPVEEEKLKAFVSIVIEGCFLVSDIKIIQGKQGLFTSMPRKKRKNGNFKDIAHPLDSATRAMLEERILAEYRRVKSGASPAAVPEMEEAADAPASAAPPVEKPISSYEDEDPTLSESFWTSSKASAPTRGTTRGTD